jgi:hypothetical protein
MISHPKPAWQTDDLEQLADTATRFAERDCLPHDARWREQRRGDREIWHKAGAAGLLCASIPEAYGGGGGHFGHEVAITQALALKMAGGFSNSVHSGIVAHYILRYGTEAQRQRWLPKMASGEMVAAIAMTEPGAGTDLQAVRTSAKRRRGWRPLRHQRRQDLHHQRLPRRPGLHRLPHRPRSRRQGCQPGDGRSAGACGLPPRAAAGQDRPAHGGHLRAVLRGHARALRPTCWAWTRARAFAS